VNRYREDDPMSSFVGNYRPDRDVVSARTRRKSTTICGAEHDLPFPALRPDAKCLKCGFDSVSMKYRPTGRHTEMREGFNADGVVIARVHSLSHSHGEWMERVCNRCSYSWPESLSRDVSTELGESA